MKIKFAIAMGCILFAITGWAQSKVFKEVSEDISSTMRVITQDDALIGYLVFTKLEKANKDSFNYQISIMDENLNDIGKVEFRERDLSLSDVAFDQDVLCLAYIKNEIADIKSKSLKEVKKSVETGGSSIFTQLLDLEGKIIASNDRKVSLKASDNLSLARKYGGSTASMGSLKHDIILKNVPGKGFVLMYGDYSKTQMSHFDFTGKELWQKDIPAAVWYSMLTTSKDIYLLSKKDHVMESGGADVRAYSVSDGTVSDKYEMKDRKGNQLKPITFQIHPLYGKPVLSGLIINSTWGNFTTSVRGLHKGPYNGVYSIIFDGTKKSEVKEKFSYWNDGSIAPAIGKNGRLAEPGLTPEYLNAIHDYKGNTFYIGNGFERKVRVGGIITGIVFLPFILPTVIEAGMGTHKSRFSNVVLLRQDSTGKIHYENSIEAKRSKFHPSRAEWHYYNFYRKFYTVTNSTTKSTFLIVDESNGTVIYNFEKRQIVRKVPFRDGNISTFIYPAKEGHIMVMEYNKKLRERKLSIEAL